MQNFTLIKSTFITSNIKAAFKKNSFSAQNATINILLYTTKKYFFSTFCVDLKLAEI